ncbi:glutamate receptor ionotropic, kainate 3-like isoform X1 [Phymastichus coffea]|uniref:glutamate receptor ionotropic, kainate 3-like isoform X1 n=1 Tax=Phymastichus coffea TaxID=108790 RepID=UPI00273AE7BC|nr:glutamate receptor ionotropic, kainate 3-like isoform X1 [Phymastichus coffea]
MFDAVALFAQAYKDFSYQYEHAQRGALLPRAYDQETPWKDGVSLRNYMLATEVMGLTGPVMIDGDGVRRRFKLSVINLHQSGLARVGEWNSEDGFSELYLVKTRTREHYRVLITLTPPYAFEKNHTNTLEGNDRYEGFVIDLIKKLSGRMSFDYTFYVQKDRNNGNCKREDKTGVCQCTGIMNNILKNEVDLAITDLTITEDRQKCVQFSTAFMSLGISILFKKPQKAEATWYSFFAPFHHLVWLCIALTFYVMGAFFYILGRLCPGEWINPFPCIDEPAELHNQFTIGNALWFVMGSKMQQGSEIMPIGLAPRILAGWWWFFCLIIVNTCIANLVAFLTVEKPVVLVKSVDDLIGQTEIKYGAKEGGSTLQYFKSSKKYRQLYDQMMDPDWNEYVVKDNNQGVEFAKRKDINYAYFMESASIEYEIKRNCELQQTGKLLDQKAYAITYAQNFTKHKELNYVMSLLQESLEIKDLKDKWWNMKGAVCGESKKTETIEYTRLTLEQMKGIFYVLGVGLALSFVYTIYEFAHSIRSISKTSELGFWTIARMELRITTPLKPELSKQISLKTSSIDGTLNNLAVTTRA